MVILFKGTDKSKNNAPQALALCAGICATKYLKKTLVMQVTAKYPVEGYVLGKRISEQAIKDDFMLFEDSGLDSLTRRAGVTAFTESHFTNAVLPAFSSENLFDILEVSGKAEGDLEMEIEKDPTVMGTIIKSAKRIYDNIFILANGKACGVISSLAPYVDKCVTCIRQGVREEISSTGAGDDYYLVTDYDYKSVYSKRYMARIYGGRKTYIMPYNVEFKDCYTDKNMLSYILGNTNPERSDYSFHLINEMTKLAGVLMEQTEPEDDTFRFTLRTLERSIREPSLLTGDNAYIEKTPKKFLKPSKTYVHVSVSGSFEKDGEDALISGEEDDKKPGKETWSQRRKAEREKKARAKRRVKERKARMKKESVKKRSGGEA